MGFWWIFGNVMRRHFNTTKVLFIGGFFLSGLISCHSYSTAPLPPPAPAGAISCTGHAFTTGEAMASEPIATSYAYWSEAKDSSKGTLQVGLVSGFADTVYLSHDTNGWEFTQPDSRVGDTSLVLNISVTNDSVIVGWVYPGIFPGSQTYFLKKLD